MEFEYCAVIDRRNADDSNNYAHLPYDDLDALKVVADAALGIPYVMSAKIFRKTREIGGKPWFGEIVFENETYRTMGSCRSEAQFRDDLKAALEDDNLFDELYKAKDEYDRLFLSG